MSPQELLKTLLILEDAGKERPNQTTLSRKQCDAQMEFGITLLANKDLLLDSLRQICQHRRPAPWR